MLTGPGRNGRCGGCLPEMIGLLGPLLGGLGLFMLGMAILTDGLKLAAGGALTSILSAWTRTRLRGLVTGTFITSVMQSSSAVTVAVIGFVNAGLLTLSQAMWVVFGANLGTTMTGWLVSQIGLRLDWAAIALPLVGLGMLAGLALKGRPRLGGAVRAVGGFGLFFLGIGVLQEAFSGLGPQIAGLPLAEAGLLGIAAFLLAGAVLTTLTQSSSAAMVIILTASAGGALPLELAAAAVIGANLGTTSTALLATIGATPAASRVAMAHVAFNAVTALGALLLLPSMLWVSEAVLDGVGILDDGPALLAAFHTLFNLLGILIIWPLAPWLARWLSTLYRSEDEELARPAFLDSNLTGTPSLALRALVLECWRLHTLSLDLARLRLTAPQNGNLAARENSLVELAVVIREFLARVSTEAMTPETARALPDLVRAVHHSEVLCLESGEVFGRRRPQTGDALKPVWDSFDRAVAKALDKAGNADTFTDTRTSVRRAFAKLKSALLEALSEGRAGVSEVDASLALAQRLRHVAEAARDGRFRLDPWLDEGGIAHPVAQEFLAS